MQQLLESRTDFSGLVFKCLVLSRLKLRLFSQVLTQRWWFKRFEGKIEAHGLNVNAKNVSVFWLWRVLHRR